MPEITIVAAEGQAIEGLVRYPFTYGDGLVEDLLGTDIIASTRPLWPGDSVLVVSPNGAVIHATVVEGGGNHGELLVTA